MMYQPGQMLLLNKWVLAGLLCACYLPLPANDTGFVLSHEDYAAAARLDTENFASLVKNAAVEPHWIEAGARFWYKRDEHESHSVVMIDSATGKRTPAFDVGAMASALEQLIGTEIPNLASSPQQINIGDNGTQVMYEHDGRKVVCKTDRPVCQHGEEIYATSGLLTALEDNRAIYVRDHNLWLRDPEVEHDIPLTEDGERYAAYGGDSDQSQLGHAVSAPGDIKTPVYTHWSPDGQWIISRRLDERQVESYPFLESVPADGSFRPRVHQVRVTLLGDPIQPKIENFIINVRTKARYPIQLPAGFDLNDYPGNMPLGWSNDARKVYIYASSVDAKIGKLIEVDMETGRSREILEEKAPGSRVYIAASFGKKMVHIIGNELVWYSERSNFGQIYLYDLDNGQLKRQLTFGEGPVHSILHIDADRRSLLVSKARGDEGFDPYEQYLYRISLDGEAAVLLTPEKAHHVVASAGVSPDGEYLVDSYSTTSTPPRTVLRSVWGNRDAVILENADATDLFALGWSAPQRVRVKAADDKTDLYAAVYLPGESFRQRGKLPVIDQNYINSIVSVTPVGFMDAVRFLFSPGLTRLGFYVVSVDGRGTPNRSRDFREAGYPAFADIQIDDHVAAIRQLGEQFLDMDVERVGIWGSSNGGAGAARAILKRPDFFQVAVSSAGSHDYMSLPPSGIKYFGVPRYENGSAVRPNPVASPENYLPFDNSTLAANLQGHLLLATGDMDNYALPSATHRLSSALIAANKNFDLLYMPNHGHFFLFDPYFKRRLRHYFVEHLLDLKPPQSVQ